MRLGLQSGEDFPGWKFLSKGYVNIAAVEKPICFLRGIAAEEGGHRLGSCQRPRVRPRCSNRMREMREDAHATSDCFGNMSAIGLVQARRYSRSLTRTGFRVNNLALRDTPSLLVVGPIIACIASASDYRLSSASQQASQSEETQQTPVSPIGSDHNGSDNGLAGWICRGVLRITRWLLSQANSR